MFNVAYPLTTAGISPGRHPPFEPSLIEPVAADEKFNGGGGAWGSEQAPRRQAQWD